jgi:hypothetical protein
LLLSTVCVAIAG